MTKTLDDCFFRGLRRIPADIDSARKSLIISEGHLDDAEASFNFKRYRLCLTSSYEAMFHASKALLFKDGIKEHSHVCVPIYLKETYPELVSYAKILDSYRLYREKATYGFDAIVNEDDAKAALEHARAILEKMKSVIE
jgi:uncharacterized protein (UPF0332 family)